LPVSFPVQIIYIVSSMYNHQLSDACWLVASDGRVTVQHDATLASEHQAFSLLPSDIHGVIRTITLVSSKLI